MSNSRFYEEEKERILAAVRAIMEHFEPYMKECELAYPTCWKCKRVMCVVLKRNEPNFFQCFENGCNGRKEWGI